MPPAPQRALTLLEPTTIPLPRDRTFSLRDRVLYNHGGTTYSGVVIGVPNWFFGETLGIVPTDRRLAAEQVWGVRYDGSGMLKVNEKVLTEDNIPNELIGQEDLLAIVRANYHPLKPEEVQDYLDTYK